MSLGSLVNAVGYATAGILLFPLALILVARLLPGDLWKQAIQEKSIPAAIVLAAVALALGWIVSSAVH